MSLISGNHIKYQLTYHLQWCTKYRYRVLKRDVYRLDYENCIRNAARRHGIEIIELSVLPEHVHTVASAPPTMTVSQILQYLKGASSFEFFRIHPEMRLRYQKGHLVSPGKFVRSVGDVDFERSREYVRNQMQHHVQDKYQMKLGKFF